MNLDDQPTHITDDYDGKDLLERIGKGDQQAFTVMVRARWNTIYSQSLAYLKSTHSAEEVTQDIFMKIWMARDRLSTVNSLDNYLFIVARNQIVNETRKKIDIKYGQFDESAEWSPPPPDLQTEYRESYRLLMKGIEELPEKRRRVFKMSRLEGMSNEQIAAELGIHKDTVYQYIVKSLLFLKTYIHEHTVDTVLILFFLAGGSRIK